MENINKRILELQNGVGSSDIARKEIYERFHTGIFKSVFTILKHPADTEDVVSDTFIKIFTCIHQYNSEKGQFSTWAYRIARNESIDHIRKKKNTLSLDDPVRGYNDVESTTTFIQNIESSTDNPSSGINEQVVSFIQERVNEDLQGLSNKPYYQIYVMKYEEGMDIEEISKKLNIAPGTIKVKLLEIREFLQGEVKNSLGNKFHFPPVDIKGRGNPIRKKLIREENKQVFLRIEKEKAAKRLLQKRK